MRSFSLRPGWPWLALATLTAAGAAAGGGYALTAPKQYRATAQLIVSPASDTAFTGIDVLRDSGGRHTAAASAAELVRSPLVADAVRALLGLRRSRDSLLAALDAQVAGSSDVVDVTIEDTSANGAAQLANAFADTLVNQRAATFQSEVAAAVRRYDGLLAAMTADERTSAAGAEIERRLAVLQSMQGQADPTLKHAGQAAAPTSPVSPDAAELVGLGAGIGAAAGLLLALVALAARRTRPAAPAGPEPLAGEALEEAFNRLAGRLGAREAAFAVRERELQQAVDELRAVRTESQEAAARDDAELAERERRLEERIAALTRHEAELARRAAELALRAREPEPPPPEPEPEPEQPEEAAAPANLVPAPAGDGAYNLVALERLLEERGAEFPLRIDEWTAYLFFLRGYAGPNGAIPAGFDWLVEETFAELLS